MGWRPWRVHLKWREPRPVRRYFDRMGKKKSYWVTAALCVFTVALFMLNWWLAVLNPDPGKNPLPFGKALALSTCGTVVLVLFLALVHRYAPSTIMIQQNWIRRIRGNSARDFKYKDIDSYSIESKTIDGSDFPVLYIRPKKGRRFAIGIASSVDLDELKKILSERMSQAKRENTEESPINVNPNL